MSESMRSSAVKDSVAVATSAAAIAIVRRRVGKQ
jgi:hypothetical protein